MFPQVETLHRNSCLRVFCEYCQHSYHSINFEDGGNDRCGGIRTNTDADNRSCGF